MLAEDAFFDLADHAARALRGGQSLLASLAGERTDFVRWNHARVRQATTVEQAVLRLTVLEGSRRDATSLTLSGVPEEDRARVASAVARLRSTLPDVPEDPYLLVSTEPGATRRVERGELPSPAEMVDVIAAAGAGTDLVGIASSGAIVRGFASSFGHRHWHEVESFQLDWSLHHDPARAVSTTFAAARWDAEALRASMDSAQRKLADLALPMVTPPPGAVRAWLSPAAMGELMTLLAWGGLSTKAQRTKTSALQRLADGEERLSPLVTLREATARGLAPAFDDAGFTLPPAVDLVVDGAHAGSLTGPRTAREYGVPANADAEEAPRALDLAPGTLPDGEVLRALDRGVVVGNLWYLNYSDRAAARITGMTRFATFWVEQGRVVGPLAVMRFDDTLYRMLGTELEALGDTAAFLPSTSTYGQRSVESQRLPGALLRSWTLTL